MDGILPLLELVALAAATAHILYLFFSHRRGAVPEAVDGARQKEVEGYAKGGDQRHSQTRAPLADGGAVDIAAMGFSAAEVRPRECERAIGRKGEREKRAQSETFHLFSFLPLSLSPWFSI